MTVQCDHQSATYRPGEYWIDTAEASSSCYGLQTQEVLNLWVHGSEALQASWLDTFGLVATPEVQYGAPVTEARHYSTAPRQLQLLLYALYFGNWKDFLHLVGR